MLVEADSAFAGGIPEDFTRKSHTVVKPGAGIENIERILSKNKHNEHRYSMKSEARPDLTAAERIKES